MGIPITIGVSGYRLVRTEDVPVLRRRVREELEKLKARCPDSEFVMLDSIAVGADTICAEEALSLGMRLICPLPMPAEEYRKDFDGEDAEIFDGLLQNAAESFVVPTGEGASRDDRYRAAGIYVAEHSHVLLALWDGTPGKPGGCGAAEIAEHVLRSGEPFKPSNDGAVIHIFTPRAGNDIVTDHPVKLLENEPGSLYETLKITNDYNADVKAAGESAAGGETLLPAGSVDGGDRRLDALHRAYREADTLSSRFQNGYMRALRIFSVFGVLLILFFLFYDELESDLFLLFYGLQLLVYVLVFLRVRRNGSHEKYLGYRMLSEALRAQYYLTAAGVEYSIGNAFTWTQKQDAAWVKEGVSALLAGGASDRPVDSEIIKTAWIDGQLGYHERAYRRDAGKHTASGRVAGWMLAASIAFFVVVFILEYFFSGAMTSTIYAGDFPEFLRHHEGQDLTLRGVFKLLLGSLPAITAFLANYYGKLSLERKSVDHKKMAALYRSAKERFESGSVDRERLFRELAREEIIENGNWFSYCRENPPSFNV